MILTWNQVGDNPNHIRAEYSGYLLEVKQFDRDHFSWYVDLENNDSKILILDSTREMLFGESLSEGKKIAQAVMQAHMVFSGTDDWQPEPEP